jgi:trimethylamine--corrinoid protein Co-methyltransferase
LSLASSSSVGSGISKLLSAGQAGATIPACLAGAVSQAGAERASTALATALSGANIVYEAAGMYASLLGTCPESLLLDNDVLGAVMRVIRGIEVNEETLSFNTIKEVCMGGEGHYLGSEQTLRVMQSEYIYSEFSDRSSPNVWEENNKPLILNQAIRKKKEIIGSHFPSHVSAETDAQIREQFPIFLSRETMGCN